MTYLLDEKGTRYDIERFYQRKGVAEVQIILVGVIYPTVYEWANCTLVLGEKRIKDVKATITDVQIDNPLNGIDPCTTKYTLLLRWLLAAEA